jgi:hypothetical protein
MPLLVWGITAMQTSKTANLIYLIYLITYDYEQH